MERKTLSAGAREAKGKNAAGRLRRQGKIPAVIYGHTGSRPLMIDEHEFNTQFRHVSENSIVRLVVDSEDHDVLVKDYQRDPVSGRIVHVDFYEFEKGKALRTRVPVRLHGTPTGVREGGILESPLHDVEVECLPTDMPEGIDVDVSGLAIGQAVHVSDLSVPQGVRVLNPPDQAVCLVVHARAEVVAAPEAAEAEEGAEAAAEGEEGEAAPEAEKAEE